MNENCKFKTAPSPPECCDLGITQSKNQNTSPIPVNPLSRLYEQKYKPYCRINTARMSNQWFSSHLLPLGEVFNRILLVFVEVTSPICKLYSGQVTLLASRDALGTNHRSPISLTFLLRFLLAPVRVRV